MCGSATRGDEDAAQRRQGRFESTDISETDHRFAAANHGVQHGQALEHWIQPVSSVTRAGGGSVGWRVHVV